MMTANLTELFGLPVVEFPAEGGAVPVSDGRVAWRVSVPTYDSDEQWSAAFERFLTAVDPATVTALIVGGWADPYEESSAPIVDSLVAAAPKLTALRSLFLADMTFEDCEISWIVQSDVTPLLSAFPALEELGIRGGTQLALEPVRHERLVRLVIQSGGLSGAVVRSIAASELPALKDLELWLGTENYGGDAAIEDVAPILTGAGLPSLSRLALRNSDIETEIAAAIASAPITARLRELDLSMGALQDAGVEALMAGQSLRHLVSIDLTHNYLTDAVRQRFEDHFSGTDVQLGLDRDGAEDYEYDGTVYRSVAVGE